ncbi:MAG TPA: heparinase II/III family protein, partial [Aggregatilineaceae bacterium]|nr:heparinase II/III family protein [Aggregatilineaceae bacterium]
DGLPGGVEGFRYEMGAVVQPDQEGNWLNERINRANEAEARRIWQLIGPGYQPIDWQLDFKSGYRWAETCWYQDIPYGHLPGVDIKVPWELARMQHLPQLAWAYALASGGEPGFEPPEVYLHEFRCQVLDFIATNPPRFGVNWAGAMDVAIRIVNWLISYDLFCAYGAQFDEAFVQELVRSAVQHGRHILANRDWHAAWRGNHYLAEMAGLFVVGVYLSEGNEKANITAERWLNFALRELDREVALQFHEDGSNFEASTCYHRLSAELIVYTAALALNLPPDKQSRFPLNHCERIEKMGEFTQHITKPSGCVPQIGDNDSGRFLKLFPAYERLSVENACARYANLDGYESDDQEYWDEDVLDHGHLLAAMNGLFGRVDWPSGPETTLVRGLAGGRHLSSYRRDGVRSAAEQVRIGADWAEQRARVRRLPFHHRQEIPVGPPTSGPLQTYAYRDFGLYVFRLELISQLTIRIATSIGPAQFTPKRGGFVAIKSST